MVATKCIINGTVRANGGGGVSSPPCGRPTGGGSGGGVRMDVGSLSGSGLIQANGGAGICSGGGCSLGSGSGGGGRIAIYYAANNFTTSRIQALGGSQSVPASAGTVYLKSVDQTYGDLFVDNAGSTSSSSAPVLTEMSQMRNVTIRNSGALRIVREIDINGDFICTSGGRIER